MNQVNRILMQYKDFSRKSVTVKSLQFNNGYARLEMFGK